jgi:hypothetical protein
MTKYAHFLHTDPAPQRVRGWFDTALFNYPKLPNAADLLQLTDAQWDERMTNPSGWAVQNGTLIKATPAKAAPTGPVSVTIPKQPSG